VYKVSKYLSHVLGTGALLTDDYLLYAYTRHHEVGIRFGDVIPHSEGNGTAIVLLCRQYPVVVVSI
jgi:hypothetical protein